MKNISVTYHLADLELEDEEQLNLALGLPLKNLVHSTCEYSRGWTF